MTREDFIAFINTHTHTWARLFKHSNYSEYVNFMHSWCELLETDFFTDVTRVYWILNDLHSFPLSKIWKKPIVKNAFSIRKAAYTYYNNHERGEDPDIHSKYVATCMTKYGVTHTSKLESTKAKQKATCLEHLGVDSPAKSQSVVSLMKQTCNERYGCDWPCQNDGIKDKYRQTCIEHFGVDSPFKSPDIRQQISNTCDARYGNSVYAKTDDFKIKSKRTSLKRHGVEHYTNIKQSHQTMKDKYGEACVFGSKLFKDRMMDIYGVEHSMQSHAIQSKAKAPYFYDQQYFKTSWELAFYIYCKDHNLDVVHNPDCQFTYEDATGKTHKYFPDFKVQDQIIEIKGDQFINELGTYQNIYDHTQDHIYEAKHQCMIANNVRIITSGEIKFYLDFVSTTYSSSYLKQFKCDKTNN